MSLLFTFIQLDAGAGKYPCLWKGCPLKFDRHETRKAHVAKAHQHEDERKLNPKRVLRNNHFFLYACRKGVRGKGNVDFALLFDYLHSGGHTHVGISCPPDEVWCHSVLSHPDLVGACWSMRGRRVQHHSPCFGIVNCFDSRRS